MRIVIVTTGRRQSLLRQTVESLQRSSRWFHQHEFRAIYDGTKEEMLSIYPNALEEGMQATGKKLGVGGAKNFGARQYEIAHSNDSPHYAGYLMFSDDDMYYLDGWDRRLDSAWGAADRVHNSASSDDKPILIGGWKHPFHESPRGVSSVEGVGIVEEVDAATGNCLLMTWKDWKRVGPFVADAVGPGQSEDFALSQKVREMGGLVATLSPPVAIHCGIVNSHGEPATGWAEMLEMATDQIHDNEIDPQTIEIRVPKEKFHIGLGLNIGSGQRRFDGRSGWINVDCVSRPPDQVPDVVCDARRLATQFGSNSVDIVVLHQLCEHFGCGEADSVIRQCYEVLKPGGSLIITVPDLKKLAGRWLSGEIDDFIFMVNVYGAYQGEDGDRHKWGYTQKGLEQYIDSLNLYRIVDMKLDGRNTVQTEVAATIKPFDWREIPGASIATDWWIAGVEIVK